MATKPIKILERAIDVLDAMSELGDESGLSAISERTGIPRSTVHRILLTMSSTGVVRKDQDHYTFGFKLLQLASVNPKQWDLISVAMPFLEELRDQLEETATLAFRTGHTHTFVATSQSRHDLRVVAVLGRETPLNCGAAGKAILAFLSEKDLEEYLATEALVSMTPRSITDPVQLLEHLKQIRDNGYAVSFGEASEGTVGVAAPIRSHDGLAYASLILAGPRDRLPADRWDRAGAVVMEVARKMEMAFRPIGYSSPWGTD